MPKAKKLPSGNWRVQVSKSVNGNLVRKSFTDSDKRRAELQALEWQSEIETTINQDNLTLSDAVDVFLQHKSNRLKPSTKIAYEKYKRNYFKDLMNCRINEIGKNDFNAEINLMLETHSHKTVKSAASFFVSVIYYFTGKRLQVEMPKKQKTIYNTPDNTTLNAIIKASEGADIELPVVLAAWLGLRISEVCGLKWSKIKGDYAIIDNAIVTAGGKHYEGAPKTSSTIRKILLPDYIKKLLEKAPKTSEYVVPMTASTIGKHFRKLLKDNNIPPCRFHDLRHANASIMLKVMPDKYAMERGGWETQSTLQGIYQQTFSQEHLEYSKKFDEYFTQNILPTSHEISHNRKKYRITKRFKAG